MKVGDFIWLFSVNRRVYSKENKNIPIYSEHFYRGKIDSETSKSWIVNRIKYSKKNPKGLYTDMQKEDAIWEHENRRIIIDKIENCSCEVLRKINELLVGKI